MTKLSMIAVALWLCACASTPRPVDEISEKAREPSQASTTVQSILDEAEMTKFYVKRNEQRYSESDKTQILLRLKEASAAASLGSDLEAYTACRQAGYSHSNCDGQYAFYLTCRRAGYSHENCANQSDAYLTCRQAGYSHSNCERQTASYLTCRQAGYPHNNCVDQLEAYLTCRQAGYSHSNCDGQGPGYLTCRQAGYSNENCSGR